MGGGFGRGLGGGWEGQEGGAKVSQKAFSGRFCGEEFERRLEEQREEFERALAAKKD
jgi:hypothetical protein